ncbi:MAG: hypothetical protein MJH09_04895 [Cetobacterium sp.]|nr:hypothetical protein [Cetobacterium sp.]
MALNPIYIEILDSSILEVEYFDRCNMILEKKNFITRSNIEIRYFMELKNKDEKYELSEIVYQNLIDKFSLFEKYDKNLYCLDKINVCGKITNENTEFILEKFMFFSKAGLKYKYKITKFTDEKGIEIEENVALELKKKGIKIKA